MNTSFYHRGCYTITRSPNLKRLHEIWGDLKGSEPRCIKIRGNVEFFLRYCSDRVAWLQSTDLSAGRRRTGLPLHADLDLRCVCRPAVRQSRHCPHSPAGSGLFRETEACLWNQAGSSLSSWLTWNHTETKKGLKAAAETSWTGRKTQTPWESCVFFMKPNCFSWNSACRDLKIVPHSVCVSVRDAAPSCASKN